MKILKKTFTDKLLLISLAVAVITLIVGRPRNSDIDWRTIGSLFALMIMVQSFQFLGVFQFIADNLTYKIVNTRLLIQILILIAFFSSMILTNDVAIITLIPLLKISIKQTKVAPELPVILLCLAANLGSILLPIGNPQNLFLFVHYNLSFINFLKMALPICLLSFILLESLTYLIKPQPLVQQKLGLNKLNSKKVWIAGISSLIVLLSILKLIPLTIGILIAIISALIISPQIFGNVDYSLLLTFICFFVAVSNISHADILVNSLKSIGNNAIEVYFSSIGLSQFLSNVPTAILFAPFTKKSYALFLGTNIGGLGTLVASLANLLAYKQYKLNFKRQNKHYLIKFTGLNVLMLLILGFLGCLLIILY